MSHFDFSPEFWRFAGSILWPPNAWNASRYIPMNRFSIASRILWLLTSYVLLTVWGIVLYTMVTFALEGSWLLAAVLLIASLIKTLIVIFRAQVSYLALKETRST